MRVDARLAIPTVVGWVALGFLLAVPECLTAVALVLWGAALATGIIALLGVRGRRFIATITFISAVTALLVTSAALFNALEHPSLLVDAAKSGRFVTATLSLNETVTASPGTESMSSGYRSSGPRSVTVTAVTIGQTRVTGISVPAAMLGEVPVAGIGATLEVAGTVATTDAGEGAKFLLFATGRVRVLAAPPWYLGWANELRAGFHSMALSLPDDGGALLPGLAIGDTSAISQNLDAAMKSTSLSHLTAVSGANCAVVVGLVMLSGAALGLSRRWKIGLSLLVLIGFVVLVTPSASVLRAAVMAALVLGALAQGRPTRGLPVLSLAVVGLLAFNPWLARDFGFALSVLATGGLLLLAAPLADFLSRWMPDLLAAMISIPVAAQLACQPVLILLNPAIPIYGIAANLLSEPAAPVATVLGLLACLLLPVVEPLGRVLAMIAWLPSAWIAAVARFFDGLPGAQAPWLSGALGVGLIALVILIALAALLLRGRRRLRTVAATLLGLLVFGYGGAVLGNWVGRSLSIPFDWQIAACDVGQGDAVLVRSEGQIALIDTGPDPDHLAECLDELGIVHIQLLILSHYDLDHVGGTPAVLGMVDHVLVGPKSDASDTRLRRSLLDSGARVNEVSRGVTGNLGELRWEVLWPPTHLGSIEPGNQASVTVRFEGVGKCSSGCLSAIFLGDLGEEAQSRMLGVAKPRPVDVVKVAHHGSADQSARLYQRLKGKVGIVSVGADNDYGHPTDALLGILNREGTVIVRTDLEGMIALSPRQDGGVGVWMQRAPERSVTAH